MLGTLRPAGHLTTDRNVGKANSPIRPVQSTPEPRQILLVDEKGNAFLSFPRAEPSKKEYLPITEKFTGKLTLKQAESIAPIGALL